LSLLLLLLLLLLFLRHGRQEFCSAVGDFEKEQERQGQERAGQVTGGQKAMPRQVSEVEEVVLFPFH
jgi:hypothetical protein